MIGALARFERKIYEDPDTGCWHWLGACTSDGYPVFKVDGSVIYVHRWAYILFKGPIGRGKDLHHKSTCPRRCCQPEHMTPMKAKPHRLLTGFGRVRSAA